MLGDPRIDTPQHVQIQGIFNQSIRRIQLSTITGLQGIFILLNKGLLNSKIIYPS